MGKGWKEFQKIIANMLLVSMILGHFSGSAQAKEKFQDAKCGALHVEDGQIVDKNGKVVQLRGVSTHGISWYPEYINEDMVKELHDKWGANLFRIAMYTDEYNGYCNSSVEYRKTLRNRVRKAVKYATKYNMYVIVDWHILSDGNPNKHISYAKSFFKMMSKEFAEHDNVIYEICNEPNGNVSWNQITSYAKKIIPIIRKNDKKAIIVVGTPTWSQDIEYAIEKPLKGYDNLMYAFHFYAGTHKQEFRSRVEKALKKKLPIFVTEFGITHASGNGTINIKGGNSWIRLLDKYQVSYCMWNLSNKDEDSAFIKKDVKKVSGLKRSDLSTTGCWYYDLLRKKAGH